MTRAYGEYDIVVEDGKYRWTADGNGKAVALRNGEPWPGGQLHLDGQAHSKSWASLMMEFQEARDALYLMGRLFTEREVASAMERRGIPTDQSEGLSVGLVRRAVKRASDHRG